MQKKFINQKDSQPCDECGEEIPAGAIIYIDSWENMVCEDCGSDQAEEDELNQFGERYS